MVVTETETRRVSKQVVCILLGFLMVLWVACEFSAYVYVLET